MAGLATGVSQNVGGWIEGTVWTAVHLMITFSCFSSSSATAWKRCERCAPTCLSRGRQADLLLERIRTMVNATVFGSLTVAAVQAVLGTFVVWMPAAFLLAAQGRSVKAEILALWGLLVVSMIDNVLYPMLVGEEIRINTALVFLAIVGGLALFVVSGLLLGPVVLVTAIGLVDVLSTRSAKQTTSV